MLDVRYRVLKDNHVIETQCPGTRTYMPQEALIGGVVVASYT